MLARHLHEAAHVRPGLPGEQGFASGRRTVMDEVVERSVVGQERDRFMDEVQSGDADRLSHRDGPGLASLGQPMPYKPRASRASPKKRSRPSSQRSKDTAEAFDSVRFNLVLPDPDYSPAGCTQTLEVPLVSLPVRLQFRLPEFR